MPIFLKNQDEIFITFSFTIVRKCVKIIENAGIGVLFCENGER